MYETNFEIYVSENSNYAYPTSGKKPYFRDQWGGPPIKPWIIATRPQVYIDEL
jgi:hypothetical protein